MVHAVVAERDKSLNSKSGTALDEGKDIREVDRVWPVLCSSMTTYAEVYFQVAHVHVVARHGLFCCSITEHLHLRNEEALVVRSTSHLDPRGCAAARTAPCVPS